MYYSKQLLLMVCLIATITGARADIIVLEGVDASTVTTGDLIDGVADSPLTVNVAEIAGLQLTARSGGADQTINVTTSSLGINADGAGDDTDAFENGELMYLSFSESVRINQMDFNLFDAGESFELQVAGQSALVITYDELDNKSSDVYGMNLEIPAGTEIQFAAGAGSVIGLDGLDIAVIPEPSVISLLSVAGIGVLMIRRLKR